MKIRLMCPEDYDEVYNLWTVTEGMCLRNYDDSREGITKFICHNPTSNFVAEESGQIIGAILCGMDGRRAYIYHATVKPECRRKGVGKELLNAVYGAIQQAGIRKNGLLVLKDNHVGNAFWRACGWQERTELNYYSINMKSQEEDENTAK